MTIAPWPLLTTAALSFVAPEQPPLTRALMVEIVDPLATLLAESFDAERFAAPTKRDELSSAMKSLGQGLDRYAPHARQRSLAFGFTAELLRQDADEMAWRFRIGDAEGARFTLHRLTGGCVACHESLPAARPSSHSDALATRIEAADLPAIARAHFFVVGRRFDEALETYESAFLSREVSPTIAIGLDALGDYLRLCIAVKNDLERPTRLLTRLRDRRAASGAVRRAVDTWLSALRELRAAGALASPDLATPQRLLREASARMLGPGDRTALIHHVVAEALLLRFVTEGKRTPAELAEAYFGLGVASDMLERSAWTRRTEFYLEAAIRLAPGSAAAATAYDLLEIRLLKEFGDASPEADALLQELYRLIATARGEKS